MTKLYITVMPSGFISAIYTSPREGTIEVNSPLPTAEEGQHLEYKGGKVVAVSDRDASAERRAAYEVECDPLLIASLGYEAEGNTEAAANCREQYLAKKAEIRERIPDEV